MPKFIRVSVVAGIKRERVGLIELQVGMLTNEGSVTSISPKSVVIGKRRVRDAGLLTVRHTEALKFGYPYAKGCTRLRTRLIRRAGDIISA